MPFSNSETYSFQDANWNSVPAVYGIMNAKKQMIYVGETDDLKRRMTEHKSDTSHCMYQYGPSLVQIEVVTAGEPARRRRESVLIAEYGPPCNN